MKIMGIAFSLSRLGGLVNSRPSEECEESHDFDLPEESLKAAPDSISRIRGRSNIMLCTQASGKLLFTTEG